MEFRVYAVFFLWFSFANDPQFRREAAQQQAAIDLARGETVAAFVERLHATPKPILDRAIALTKSVGD